MNTFFWVLLDSSEFLGIWSEIVIPLTSQWTHEHNGLGRGEDPDE